MKKNSKNKEKKERNFIKTKNISMTIYFIIGTLFFLSVLGIFDVFDFDDNIITEIWYPSEVVYDFENDVIGEHPDGWSGMQWNGTEVIVWELNESFGQVVEVENRDDNNVELATRFKKAKSGVIEFDIYCDYNERVNIDITQLTEDWDPVDDICN